MYLLFSLGVLGWGIYGWLNRDWPVFVANLITFPATAAILDRKIRAQLLLSRKGYEQGQ